MVRRTFNEGFLMAEACIALMIAALLGLLCLSFPEFTAEEYYRFPYVYLLSQSQAMASSSTVLLHTSVFSTSFNGSGNIRSAATVHFDSAGKEIVAELGGGRLVFK